MIYAHIDTHQDFHYSVEVDYDVRYDCHDSGCDEDGICRCGVIENASVKEFYPGSIMDWLGSTMPKDASDLDQYLLERLVKLTVRTEMFEVTTCGGYYGEEIDSVMIDTGTQAYQEFARKIEAFNRLTSTTEQVQMILTLEYGYLLPEIAAIEEWDVLNLPIKQVHADDGVLSRISKEIAQGYIANPPSHGIRGVVVPRGDGYRLVDGFHRYAAWMGLVEAPPGHAVSRKKKPKTRRKIKVLGPKGVSS